MRLKPAKNRLNGRLTVLQNPGRTSWSCGRNNSAANAGDNVSDTMAEMIVEAAMVSGKLPIEGARNAGDEGGRNEDRAEHERDRDQRTADLFHRLISGITRAQALAQIALDVLHHHDRVVHDNANREDESEQRQVVQREAERRHDEERADQRNRNGDDRDDRGAPRLQEQDNDDHDQDDGLEDGLDHLVDRLLDELRGVVDDAVAHPFREAPGKLLHRAEHGRRGGERVRARPLENSDRGRDLVVQIGVGRVVLRAKLYPGDVANAGHPAVLIGGDNNVAELVRARQPAERLHGDFEPARRRRRRLVDGAGSHLDVGGAQRRDHVAGGETAGLDLRGVEPHPHGVVARTEHDRVADPIDAGDHILDVDARVVGNVLLVQASVRARSDG